MTRIAVVQPALALGEVERNLERVEDLIRDAHREHGAEVIVVPEGFTTPNVYARVLRETARADNLGIPRCAKVSGLRFSVMGDDPGCRKSLELAENHRQRWTSTAAWVERAQGFRLIERKPMPPLGHFSLIRFGKDALAAAA